MTEVVEKKKRGRKKKEQVIAENIQLSINLENESLEQNEPPVAKKRGRKPKGGKIVSKEQETNISSSTPCNIILHLKCSLNDLDLDIYESENAFRYNPTVPPEIQTYDKKEFSIYEETNSEIQYAYLNKDTNIKESILNDSNYTSNNISNEDNIKIKDINTKLKNLKINLYKDNLHDKKSACFWCTYSFDNPPCYIPKNEFNDTLFGYGSFCRPECAVAYLMKENIDDSAKFERYSLLNSVYSKIYDFKKNIKPAPNPYYLLDKFYGNLSIQEYRRLLNSEHLMLVIDKPMTRLLPELFEDNDNFSSNIYNNSSQQNNINVGMYKVKRQSEKKEGPSKTSIINDTFGLA